MNWAPGAGRVEREEDHEWRMWVCQPFRMEQVEPAISEAGARRTVCLKHALNSFGGLASLILGHVSKAFGLSWNHGEH